MYEVAWLLTGTQDIHAMRCHLPVVGRSAAELSITGLFMHIPRYSHLLSKDNVSKRTQRRTSGNSITGSLASYPGLTHSFSPFSSETVICPAAYPTQPESQLKVPFTVTRNRYSATSTQGLESLMLSLRLACTWLSRYDALYLNLSHH